MGVEDRMKITASFLAHGYYPIEEKGKHEMDAGIVYNGL